MNKWKKVKIKDVCTKGTSSLSLKDLDGKDGDFPVYGAAGLAKKVNFYQQENKYLAIIKDGSGVGRLYRFDGKTSVLGTMQYIFPSDSIDYSFCYYALQSIDFKKYVNGAAIPHIYFKDYSQEEIPLLAMEEQKKIAARLDAVSDLLAKQKQLLSEQDNLIKSVFYDLLNKGMNEKKNIASLVNPKIEKISKHFSDSDQIKYIDISSINNESFSIDKTTEYLVKNAPSRAQQHVKKDDVLISTVRPNLKNIAIVKNTDKNLIASSGFCVLRAEKCFPSFLFHTVLSDKFTIDMTKRTKGANYPAISSTDVLNYEIPVPPLELQQKFAAIVEQIESEKSKIKSAIAETQPLFNALMAEYFED